MLQPMQHSVECWFWAIPKSIVPTAPKFPMGQMVKLSKMYQHDPYAPTYGEIIGVEWNAGFGRWSYSIQVPSYHRYCDDIEVLNEVEVEQRLKDDDWELPIATCSG